jgi:hypothetical protein
MEQFERAFQKDFRLDKEDKCLWSKGHIYQNSEANAAFKFFIHGYAFGKHLQA